ncbi:MAG: 23S rRNA (adenine(2030)-N(6))-methyltransferase RlmJ [Alphaproteobacteria bacterium]|nr:23S rRNA (adenine(2030)-N(6))-methyltransferase RlmJ [Alphaproteobacteria bacterium]
MNYRHIYHAGNRCDVVKHATLSLIIDHLKQKPAPFCVLDTHAGIGLYNLSDDRAQKTNEAQDGIIAYWQAPRIDALSSYHHVIEALNPLGSLTQYPGSPALIARLLRPGDRYVGCEWHSEDAETLKHTMWHYPQAQIHHRNGYEALSALLPPAEKRGLVLIDPPFEQPDEFDEMADRTIAAYGRWSQGIYALWYPIKERPALWRFQEKMAASGIRKQLVAEFVFQEETRSDRLNGSGMLIINPPWQLADTLQTLYPQLHSAMRTEHQASDVRWLVGE